MFTSITRPYKERSAQETIATLRAILADLDLLPEETFHANPYPEIFSVSLELPASKGGFRANGKGRTPEYCLASAYAEFVERMQNGLFAAFPRTIVARLEQTHGYYYTPDERYLQAADLAALPLPIVADIVRYNGGDCKEFMDAYVERVRDNGAPGVVSVPFFDTRSRTLRYLPLNLLLLTVGSNGMAAGNTTAEAIFQALCELLERWGAAEVFYKQLSPPSIDREHLGQFPDECAIIDAIERSGKYRVTVKDFSAGRRIPSLGLIVENLPAHTYRLNVGCDTCLQVALSRCLTEVYQGIGDEAAFDASTLPIPQDEAPYFVSDDDASRYQRFRVFAQFTRDNSGPFPASLFRAQPDYDFDPTVWTQKLSYEAEVRRLVAYFHSQGHTIYLRDVSFLGFPSVFVYIPEVSAQGRKNAPPPVASATPIMLELDSIEPLALRLKQCSGEDLAALAQVFERFAPSTCLVDIFGIKLREDSPWRLVNTAFLLTLIWYRLGQLDNARASFQKFLQTRPDRVPYYDLAATYLDRRAEGMAAQQALASLLEDAGDKETARQVAEDLDDPASTFRWVRLPNCPDCDGCELAEECVTRGKVATAHSLYRVMPRKAIDQRSLAWVVSGESEE